MNIYRYILKCILTYFAPYVVRIEIFKISYSIYGRKEYYLLSGL